MKTENYYSSNEILKGNGVKEKVMTKGIGTKIMMYIVLVFAFLFVGVFSGSKTVEAGDSKVTGTANSSGILLIVKDTAWFGYVNNPTYSYCNTSCVTALSITSGDYDYVGVYLRKSDGTIWTYASDTSVSSFSTSSWTNKGVFDTVLSGNYSASSDIRLKIGTDEGTYYSDYGGTKYLPIKQLDFGTDSYERSWGSMSTACSSNASGDSFTLVLMANVTGQCNASSSYRFVYIDTNGYRLDNSSWVVKNYTESMSIRGSGSVVSWDSTAVYNYTELGITEALVDGGTIGVYNNSPSGGVKVYATGARVKNAGVTDNCAIYNDAGYVSVGGDVSGVCGIESYGSDTQVYIGSDAQISGSTGKGIHISGGTLEISDDYDSIVTTITGATYGVYATGSAKVTLTKGTIQSPVTALSLNGATLTMSGGTIQRTGTTGEVTHCAISIDSGSNTVTISGGVVKTEYTYADAISVSGTSATANISISGGTITGSNAVYTRSGSTLTITGGTFYTIYNWAIYSYGTATISGGTIYAGDKSNADAAVYNHNSLTISSNAIITATQRANGVRNSSGNVTISGGTITSVNSAAVSNEANSNYTMTISGGTISSTGAQGVGNYGNMIINGSPKITGTKGIWHWRGDSLNVSGTPTITGTAGPGLQAVAYEDDNANTVTISSGTISGSTYGIYNQYEGVNISGGTISGTTYGVFNETGTVCITGGSISGTTKGIYNTSTVTRSMTLAGTAYTTTVGISSRSGVSVTVSSVQNNAAADMRIKGYSSTYKVTISGAVSNSNASAVMSIYANSVLSSTLSNSGTAYVYSGASVAGTSTNTGYLYTAGTLAAITNNSGGTLNVEGGTTGAITNNSTTTKSMDLAGTSYTVTVGIEATSSRSVTVASVSNTVAGKVAVKGYSSTYKATVSGTASNSNASGYLYIYAYGTLSSTLSNSGYAYAYANAIVSGTTTNAGTLSISGGSVQAITNSGTGTVSSGSATTVTNSGTFTVSGGSTGNVTNTGSLNVSGGTIGTVTNNSGGTVYISRGTTGAITNKSTTTRSMSLAGTSYTTTIGISSNSSGAATVASVSNTVAGKVHIKGYSSTYKATVSGAVGNSNASGYVYVYANGVVSGTTTNAGTLSVSGGSVQAITNSGTGTVSSGSATTVTNSGTFTVSGGSTGNITNTGILNVSGSTGAITNNSGGTVYVSGGSTGIITNNSSATRVMGDYTVTVGLFGGEVSNFYNDAGTSVIAGSEIPYGVRNYGVLTHVSGILGLMFMDMDYNVIYSTLTNTGTFYQQGGRLDFALDNSGTFVMSGNTISGGVTNTGTFNMSAGTVSRGFVNNNAATITGGKVSGGIVTSGTLTIGVNDDTVDSTADNALEIKNTSGFGIFEETSDASTYIYDGVVIGKYNSDLITTTACAGYGNDDVYDVGCNEIIEGMPSGYGFTIEYDTTNGITSQWLIPAGARIDRPDPDPVEETLQGAVDKIESYYGGAGTIYVLDDLVESVLVDVELNIELYLDGHSITAASGESFAITNNGVLYLYNDTSTVAHIYAHEEVIDDYGAISNTGYLYVRMDNAVIESKRSNWGRGISNTGTGTTYLYGTAELKDFYYSIYISGGLVYLGGSSSYESIKLTPYTYGVYATGGTVYLDAVSIDPLVSSGGTGVYFSNAAPTVYVREYSSIVASTGISGNQGHVGVEDGYITATSVAISTSGTLSISGGTIESTGTGTSAYAINITGGTTNITGGTITGYTGIVNNGTLNVSGGTIIGTSGYAISNKSTSSNAVVISGSAKINASNLADGIYNYSSGTVTINNGTITVTGEARTSFGFALYNNSTGKIVVNNVTINVTKNVTGTDDVSRTYDIGAIKNYSTGTIDINGGTIRVNANISNYTNSGTSETNIRAFGIHNYSSGTINLNGGNIHVTSTSNTVSNTGEGTVTISTNGVLNASGLIKLDGSKLTSTVIASGLTSVGSSECTIYNSSGQVNMLSGEIVGTVCGIYNVSTSETAVLISGGSITAGDSSSINAISGIYNASTGTIDISGGEISAISGTNAATSVRNGSGVILVSGGTFSANSSASGYIARNIYNSTGTVTVTGGMFSANNPNSNSYGIHNYSTGVVNYGGNATITLENNSSNFSAGIYNVSTGTVNVTGGTITVKNANTDAYGIYSRGGKVEIDDGEISAESGVDNSMGVVITGGELVLNYAVINSTGNSNAVGVSPYGGTTYINGGIITASSAGNSYGVQNNSTLYVANGSINGNIGLYNVGAYDESTGDFISGLVYITGTYLGDGATITGNHTGVYNSGEMYINAGSITGNTYGIHNLSHLTLEGGTIEEASNTGIYNESGLLDVDVIAYAESGEISHTAINAYLYGIHNVGGFVIIEDVSTVATVINESDSVAAIYNENSELYDEDGDGTGDYTIKINSGSFTIAYSMGNVIHNKGGKMVINNGMLTAHNDCGLYNESGTIDIATLTVNADTAVLNKGTLNISNGDFYGSGGYGINNNGTVKMTGGIVTSANVAVYNTGTFTVTGGRIEAQYDAIDNNGKLVVGSNSGTPSQTTPEIRSDNQFGIYELSSSAYTHIYDGKIIGKYSSDLTTTSACAGYDSNGQYDVGCNEIVDERTSWFVNYPPMPSGYGFTIVYDTAAGTATQYLVEAGARISRSDPDVVEKTLQGAINKVKNYYSGTGTIYVLADLVESITVDSGQNIKLYLMGHSLTAASAESFTVTNNGTLYLYNNTNADTSTTTAYIYTHASVTDSYGAIKNSGTLYSYMYNTIVESKRSNFGKGILNSSGIAYVYYTTEVTKFWWSVYVSAGTVYLGTTSSSNQLKITPQATGVYAAGGTIYVRNALIDPISTTANAINVNSTSAKVYIQPYASIVAHTGIVNNGTVTMSGGTISGATTAISNTGTLTISGGTINATTYGINNGSTSTSAVTMSGGTINVTRSVTGTGTSATTYYAYGINNTSTGTVAITGGTINVTHTVTDYTKNVDGDIYFESIALRNYSTGKINANGGTITATLNLTNLTKSGTGNFGYRNSGIYNNSTGIVTVNGANITNSIVSTNASSINYMSGAGIYNPLGSVTIYSGTIKAPTTVISNGGTLVVNNGTLETTVTSGDGYAINNLASGTATINNGTMTGRTRAVVNKGTMTIKGGTISGSMGLVIDSGTVTMSGGTITGSERGGYIASASAKLIMSGGTISGTNYGIVSVGLLELSNGSISINDPNYTCGRTAVYNSGNMVMTGGNVSEGNCGTAIDNKETGTLTISGGSITSSDVGVANYSTKTNAVIVNGGATISGSYVGIENNSSSLGVTVQISSGVVFGSFAAISNNKGSILITGGTIGERTLGNNTEISPYGIQNRNTSTNVVTISGGTIKGSEYGINTSTGTVSINGSTALVTSTSGDAIYNTSLLEVRAGEIRGYTRGIYNESSVTLNGGLVSSTATCDSYGTSCVSYGIHSAQGTVTINSNAKVTSSNIAIYNKNNDVSTTVVVNDGVIGTATVNGTAIDSYYGIYNAYYSEGGSVVEINGGEIIGIKIGIYTAGKGLENDGIAPLKINGGIIKTTYTCSGKNPDKYGYRDCLSFGVRINSGSTVNPIEITGGTILGKHVGVFAEDGKIHVKGGRIGIDENGIIESYNGFVNIGGSDLHVTGDVIIAGTNYGLSQTNGYGLNQYFGTPVSHVDGGIITGEYAAIMINSHSINISSGHIGTTQVSGKNIVSEYGLYHRLATSSSITGGTIKGLVGILNQGGVLDVKNGSVEGENIGIENTYYSSSSKQGTLNIGELIDSNTFYDPSIEGDIGIYNNGGIVNVLAGTITGTTAGIKNNSDSTTYVGKVVIGDETNTEPRNDTPEIIGGVNAIVEEVSTVETYVYSGIFKGSTTNHACVGYDGSKYDVGCNEIVEGMLSNYGFITLENNGKEESYLVSAGARIEIENVPDSIHNGIQEAINNIDAYYNDVGKIVLLRNAVDTYAENVSIKAGLNITIELNGKSWSSEAATITNAGTLTINGTGTIESTVNECAKTTIENTGTFVMNGGTIIDTDTCTYVIKNTGTATINGGTVGVSNRSDTGIGNFGSGVLTVNGGTIQGASFGIENNGSVTINNGTIESGYGSGIYTSAGTLNIKGGSVTAISGEGLHMVGGTIVVDAGTITGELSAIYIGLGSLTINGGEIASNGYALYAYRGNVTYNGGTLKGSATNNYVYDMASGVTYSTGTKSEYTVIESGKYVTVLKNALQGSTDGTIKKEISEISTTGTIKLLDNMTEASIEIPAGKNITLDLGGKLLNSYITTRVATHKTSEPFITVKGELTIINGSMEMYNSMGDLIYVEKGGVLNIGRATDGISTTTPSLKLVNGLKAVLAEAGATVNYNNGLIKNAIDKFEVQYKDLYIREGYYIEHTANEMKLVSDSSLGLEPIYYKAVAKVGEANVVLTITHENKSMTNSDDLDVYLRGQGTMTEMAMTCSSSGTVTTCTAPANQLAYVYNAVYEDEMLFVYRKTTSAFRLKLVRADLEIIPDLKDEDGGEVKDPIINEVDDGSGRTYDILSDGEIFFIDITRVNDLYANNIAGINVNHDSIKDSMFGPNWRKVFESVTLTLEEVVDENEVEGMSNTSNGYVNIRYAIIKYTAEIREGYVIPESYVLEDQARVLIYDYSPKLSVESSQAASLVTCEYGSNCAISPLSFYDYLGNELSNVETVITKDGEVVESIDTSELGTYVVTSRAKDMFGARSLPVVQEYVVKDNVAPVLKVSNEAIVVNKGSQIEDIDEIEISDNYDKVLMVERIDSEIDVNKAGTYKLGYRVVDSNGNETIVYRDVIVKEVSNSNVWIWYVIGITLLLGVLGVASFMYIRKRK